MAQWSVLRRQQACMPCGLYARALVTPAISESLPQVVQFAALIFQVTNVADWTPW